MTATHENDTITYTDKRLMATTQEIHAAADRLRDGLENWVKDIDLAATLGAGDGKATNARTALIIEILRAINTKRLGHAEGSIARHTDGRVAKRYYDKIFCCLRWIVLENEQQDNVTADRLDELGGDWTIVHDEPWKVTTRYGEKLPI